MSLLASIGDLTKYSREDKEKLLVAIYKDIGSSSSSEDEATPETKQSQTKKRLPKEEKAPVERKPRDHKFRALIDQGLNITVYEDSQKKEMTKKKIQEKYNGISIAMINKLVTYEKERRMGQLQPELKVEA